MSGNDPSADIGRTVYQRLGKSGRIALVIGLAAGALLVWGLWSVTSAAILSASAGGSKKAEDKQRVAELSKTIEERMEQFKGRTIFYKPAKPGPPPEPEKPTEQPGTPAVASSYGGPSIIAMINDAVWFSDGTRIKIGEKSGDSKLLSINPPWTAKIEYKGAAFDVPFFEKDAVVLNKTAKASATSLAPVAPSSSSLADSSKPADAKPIDSKTADGKPNDAKKAGDAKPGEAKPADSKPADSKPGDGKPPEPKPGENKPQPNPAEKPGEGTPPPGPPPGPGPDQPPPEPKAPAGEETR